MAPVLSKPSMKITQCSSQWQPPQLSQNIYSVCRSPSCSTLPKHPKLQGRRSYSEPINRGLLGGWRRASPRLLLRGAFFFGWGPGAWGSGPDLQKTRGRMLRGWVKRGHYASILTLAHGRQGFARCLSKSVQTTTIQLKSPREAANL